MLLFIGIERKFVMKNRYWVSWWSGYYDDEGCTEPLFQIWISGQRNRVKDGKIDNKRNECSICAVIDAESEDEIWEVVKKHFPDMEERFCELRDFDYDPSVGGRFRDFENKTSLY